MNDTAATSDRQATAFTWLDSIEPISGDDGFRFNVAISSTDSAKMTVEVGAEELQAFPKFQKRCLRGYGVLFDAEIYHGRRGSEEWRAEVWRLLEKEGGAA